VYDADVTGGAVTLLSQRLSNLVNSGIPGDADAAAAPVGALGGGGGDSGGVVGHTRPAQSFSCSTVHTLVSSAKRARRFSATHSTAHAEGAFAEQVCSLFLSSSSPLHIWCSSTVHCACALQSIAVLPVSPPRALCRTPPRTYPRVRRKVLPGAIAEGDDAATMVLGSVGLDASIDSMQFGT
jgi:hypothetical protein